MPKNGTRDRDTRQKILDAARRLGQQRGYTGTTMAAISRESGVHPGSLYWYFADKDATFAAVIRETYAADIAGTPVEGEPVQRTLELMHAVTSDPRRLGQWRFNALLMLDPALAGSQSRQAFAEVRRTMKQRLTGHWVEQLPADAPPELSERLAAAALALVDGAMMATASGEEVDLRGLAEGIVRSLDASVDAAWRASALERPEP